MSSIEKLVYWMFGVIVGLFWTVIGAVIVDWYNKVGKPSSQQMKAKYGKGSNG